MDNPTEENQQQETGIRRWTLMFRNYGSVNRGYTSLGFIEVPCYFENQSDLEIRLNDAADSFRDGLELEDSDSSC
ncbi:hypothetical protein DdX_10697 [Ditylenchus destructor]|uniref:Uncharacterized protein n=1 Tax=Ditylenchus destructor TaxID=166010 RepID=A0AAD4N023_9BILA|nr:hypothetical protein DdX_10697 [Ditylenchus destructor]